MRYRRAKTEQLDDSLNERNKLALRIKAIEQELEQMAKLSTLILPRPYDHQPIK